MSLLELPSLNRGGGLRHQFSATYSAVLGALPRRFGPRSHFNPCDFNVSHDGRGRQWLSESHLGLGDPNGSHEGDA